MTFLKTVLVTLFSLVLIGSQTVLPVNAATQQVNVEFQSCTSCPCGEMDCCIQESSSSPGQPIQSVPVNSNVQTQQFIAAVYTLLLHQPPSAPHNAAFASHGVPSAPAVPLFKQNCTFLI